MYMGYKYMPFVLFVVRVITMLAKMWRSFLVLLAKCVLNVVEVIVLMFTVGKSAS